MKRHQRVITVAASALVLGGGFLYWRHAAHASKSRAAASEASGDGARPSVSAEVIELKRKPLTDVVEGLVGTVKGNTIELTFNGQEERITAVHVRVGRYVKKRAVLFELDHTRSRARKSQALANFERTQELQEAGGATLRDVQEARATLNLAQKDYDDTFIYAPRDGFICQVNRQEGETVGRSEVVGVLVSAHNKFYVETGVIEGLLDQVAPGQTATVQIEAFGNKDIRGTVQGVSREVTTTGRTGTVLISLPDSIQSKLRPGLSARCSISVFDSKRALVIPRAAYDSQKNCVYVLDEKNRAQMREVKLGHITRDHYQVLRGLQEGDRLIKDIVATPVDPGSLVNPILAPPEEASGGAAGASS